VKQHFFFYPIFFLNSVSGQRWLIWGSISFLIKRYPIEIRVKFSIDLSKTQELLAPGRFRL